MNSKRRDTVWVIIFFVVVLSLLFSRSYKPGQTLFSSDGPLGLIADSAYAVPESFLQVWQDANWLGVPGGSFPLTFSQTLRFLGPVGLSKWLAPISVLVAGIAGYVLGRKLSLHPFMAAVLGVAALLNMNYFSNACWGLGGRSVTQAAALLAIAAVINAPPKGGWLRFMLCGLLVGIAVMEGADVGAIYSIFLAAFVAFHTWVTSSDGPQRIGRAIGRVTVVALLALFMAFQFVGVLINTNIKGGVVAQQEQMGKEARWIWATQWSLPKIETLRIIIPGLFGYRMDTENANYWGAVGQTPGQKDRHSGSGEYAGITVVLIAAWAVSQALRKQSSFTSPQRKLIFFWLGVAVVSLLLGFGRHAPFYQVIYQLPYFSSIRNPIKFLHITHLAILVLTGYGLLHLSGYLKGKVPVSIGAEFSNWWRRSSPERRWTYGAVATLVVAGMVALIYAGSTRQLVKHLGENGFPAQIASGIAKSSQHEVWLFVVFLALSIAALALIVSGALKTRVALAGGILATIIAVDLGRANKNWIIYYDYKQKYASNPVLEMLKEKPFEQRVTAQALPLGGMPLFFNNADPVSQNFYYMYYVDWLQGVLPFMDIQALDIVQMPRPPALDGTYMTALRPTDPSQRDIHVLGRLWQLTNTRWVLYHRGNFEMLRQIAASAGLSLDEKQRFALEPAGPSAVFRGVTAEGSCGIAWLNGSLPRTQFFSDVEYVSDEQQILTRLTSREFDPNRTVLVSGSGVKPTTAAATNQPGSATIRNYKSTKIMIDVDAPAAGVLMLNDRWEENWKVFVDGNEKPILRCNYIMRGVELSPGKHLVEFRYALPRFGLYLNVAAIVLMIGIAVVLGLERRGRDNDTPMVT